MVIRSAAVLDTSAMRFDERDFVVVEDGVIVAVGGGSAPSGDVVIDAGGGFLLPGLIDAHVHFRLATFDFRALAAWSEVEFGIVMAKLATATLERGFTTVRDLGGEVTGLMRAIASGSTPGPRIVRAGHMLTQTGGHGDAAGAARPVPHCGCALDMDVFSIVADGPDAVRKAARHLLREGSEFLKIHVSGGVASPSDPLDSVQYTPEEITVAVTEAQHRSTYVAAHAYSPTSIRMAVDHGVTSIEHGNLLDADTARRMAAANATLVPTLVTYHAMQELGADLGLPGRNLEKNASIYAAGLASIEHAVAANVTMGFGTDLIGESQPMQARELTIRAEVQPAADILRSMWLVNPRLCHLEGRIGTITPGAIGDLVISQVDPLEHLSRFADTTTSLNHVIQHGRVVVDRT
jgi:imidazolonepropionase-like amidohydrolase